MNYTHALLFATLSVILAACGGGSDSGQNDSPSSSTEATDVTDETDQDDTLIGRFVDSAVIGMSYETQTQSGTTDENGSFNYTTDETVTFSLGDVTLPPVAASSLITPLDIFDTDSIADTRVVNLIRLLQTLDTDATPENGITISDTAISSATGLTLDFASTNFDAEVVNLVANSGSSNTALISPEDAMDHFMETLFAEGVQERPAEVAETDAPAEEEPATTTEATASHPLVGTSTQFRNIFHGIAGTLTVIDDRTLEVTGFEYDGEGPSVFFYLGTDGLYAARDGGILVGNRLNRSTPYLGETLTINLPNGVTLDDFNGVSVWCDLFFANFGDAVF